MKVKDELRMGLTVAELILELEKYDDEMPVVFSYSINNPFNFVCNSVGGVELGKVDRRADRLVVCGNVFEDGDESVECVVINS